MDESANDEVRANRVEEARAIERERAAFERRQNAFRAITAQLMPRGTGILANATLAELDAANAEWEAAKADIDRISGEIRAGRRR